jgi:hypothetical protein
MNPDAVRPGTSDALFARTIDATIYPPLVRAQETAITLVPRLAEAAAPLASPLFLGALALTLVFSWIAIRMRYRPSALVLGVLLVMALTSFNPAQKPEQPRVAEVSTPTTRIGGTRASHRNRMYVPAPQVEAPDQEVPAEPVQVYFAPDFVERIRRDAMQSAERMMREDEGLREMMHQIRYRLLEEARRRRWREITARKVLARR